MLIRNTRKSKRSENLTSKIVCSTYCGVRRPGGAFARALAIGKEKAPPGRRTPKSMAVGFQKKLPPPIRLRLSVRMSFREFHYRWEFDLKASPEQLWPFVADTNRFNRDTGVPKIDFEPGDKRLPNARRRMRLSIYGLPIEWEEQPFEWIRPNRFGVERAYSRGPMARMKALAQLEPKMDGGTHLTYDVWATPRNLVGTVFIPLQINIITSRKLRAAFQKYDQQAV